MAPTFFTVIILHTTLILLFLSTRAQAQARSYCLNNNGNYTCNSTYAANLNVVLSSIPDTIDSATGFLNASASRAPDRAHVIALCRGDVQPEICRVCIRNTTSQLLTSCPNQRQAASWSKFCMLRYSNDTLYGIMAPSPPGWFLWNMQNATDPTRFMQDLRMLIDGLRGRAAEGGPRQKVAAGNVSTADFQVIFALVQCTPDLTADDCSQCLIGAAQDIPRLRELEPPPVTAPLPPAPVEPQPSPPGTGGGNNTTRTAIIVVVSVVACVILAIFAGVLLRRKRVKQKPEEQHQTDDISNSVESLKYSLTTLREATNDFADVNKLGQGGFGTVYKGVLPNGLEIAVKRLGENSGQGDVEFKNEVLLLAKLQHRNLVRLLGYCLEGTEKLLVYEFVQNASLDQFIFDPVKRSFLFFSVQSFCYDNGNYTVNSTYATNLNAVLSSIPDNIDVASGFYNASAGRAPDRAYATALCRGDVQPEICRGCIRNLTADLLAACPYQRQAIEWAELCICILRYSNETLTGTPPQFWPSHLFWNTQNATNPARFMEDLRALLDGLRDRAAAGGPRRKVAAANVTYNDFQDIFALVQCSPDLTADDCSSCLIGAAGEIPTCCDRRVGGGVLLSSCTIRYETYPFYNMTRLRELESAPPAPAPLPPPPPPPGTSGGNNSKTRTIIIVVVSVAASLMLAIFAFVLFRKRTKRKPEEQHQTDDISNFIESLKYSFTTLREATNDFSDVNKLGQGGFGTVYKGVLPNGQEIAVKRLAENSGQGDVEFKNEVLLLAKLQHRNLVRLLGYCLEGTEKLLVGYMAPEYAMHGQFSVKSDVFSFGVLVLEIISGEKNNCVRPANIVDPCLRSGLGSIREILRCIHIGLLCVQENPADRPTMASVVLMLNSFSLTLAAPSEPAFYMPSDYGSDSSLLQEHRLRESDYKNSSKSSIPSDKSSSRNDASITDLYPPISCISFSISFFFSAQSSCFSFNYTANSTYAANLHAVLSSIPATIPASTGFFNASLGRPPDRAHANALCRADIQPEDCQICVRNITANLLAACPYQRQAAEWWELCTLRYSNETLLGTLQTSPYVFVQYPHTAASPENFTADLWRLLDDLRGRAAAGGPLIKVAAGNTSGPDFQNIYALVQCSPDLSEQDCTACLMEAAQEIPRCCGGRAWARITMSSCNLQFRTVPFYNETRLLELQLAVPPAPEVEPPQVAPETPPGGGDGNNTTRTIIIVVVAVVSCIIVAFLACTLLRTRIKRKPQERDKSDDKSITIESLKYAISTIREATNDFSDTNKLGQGGFGAVYKGVLSNGAKIAVKRLSENSGQGDVEFKNEVVLLAKLQHRNLVRLLGFCLEGAEKLLVYEFVQNTSLDHFIFEYALHGQFSVKSDVFSFGVLLLEIISGLKNNSVRRGENIENLLSFAWKNWKDQTTANLVDPCLRSGAGVIRDMVRCIHIGLLCVQENPTDRPTMASVVVMLNSFSITLAVPSEPAFYMPSDYGSNMSQHNSRESEYKSSLPILSDNFSRNEASITDLYPR
ncbi:cysteine-rich receptor-like protein kinase [Striga asiatica]|uniref:Cysteine-rich receptor-like protein kinase n=1 Tax=Striga asiatica TaxID=4170 RepID=A0A5A7R5E0_STRAF|nr:cysteine-rich receptor-like protein kinase [Striga asiatica]